MKRFLNLIENLFRARETKRDDSFFEVESLFSLLAHHTGDIVAISDMTGRVRFVNKSGRLIVGLSETEAPEKYDRLRFYPPAMLERMITEVTPALEAHGEWNGEFYHRNIQTGEEIPVYMRLFYLRDPQTGNVKGRALVARDLREEKKREREDLARHKKIQALKEEAVEASRAKTQFLANMSHEIRTPINGVVGMTSLLLDSSLTPEQKDYAENIKTSADSLLSIVNDILEFSKVEAGKVELENADFDLVTLIDETVKNISFMTKLKSIPLLVDVKPNAQKYFYGDSGRIRQILLNLLTNAVKFTHSGTIKIEARVDYSTERLSVVRFSVTDTGIGMTPAQMDRIFHAFAQADGDTNRKFGGTGLGLSISKKLVELMKGRLAVESQIDKGSTFWFTIPLENTAVITRTKTAAVEIIPTKHPHAQILVAEDNFVNQKIVLAMLSKLGFSAQAVANGQEALATLKERHFDLVLMDCQMPEMDGYEATKKIRASFEKSFSRIPIIALTANALTGDRELCLAVGMDDYASKPVHIAHLAELIEKWLDVSIKKQSA